VNSLYGITSHSAYICISKHSSRITCIVTPRITCCAILIESSFRIFHQYHTALSYYIKRHTRECELPHRQRLFPSPTSTAILVLFCLPLPSGMDVSVTSEVFNTPPQENGLGQPGMVSPSDWDPLLGTAMEIPTRARDDEAQDASQIGTGTSPPDSWPQLNSLDFLTNCRSLFLWHLVWRSES
jgi:hypothetical protein